MKPLIFAVSPIGAGMLCIMPHPEGRYLREAVTHFQRLGIGRVVCLLEEHEIHKLGLEKEAPLCAQAGIGFTHFPIPDSNIPAAADAFAQLVENLHAELRAGANISIHCRAGIGRTGVLAACILKRDGRAAETAMRMLSGVRGFPMPETEAQRTFILDFAADAPT